ncbi:phosphogluconate dehydratase [Salmonella enterica subsp. enterica serovar Tallahassee str. 0012]|nr:phosphogluconate dehydratase [Salmonella enterica subsp. enterica serovar Tallahassee str. 0012]
MNPNLLRVTQRIVERSQQTRKAYLARIEQAKTATVHRSQLACGNLAHGFAACQPEDKASLKSMLRNNIAIITSYNDMLSAHQPYEHYPQIIRQALHSVNAVGQVAGGVPAMCDGVTQGQDGMELSLLSREVIAMSAAVGLSHNMFDGALFLGVCDKIVPGLAMAALSFGHLPAIFVPSGPMASGLPNKEKSVFVSYMRKESRQNGAAGVRSRLLPCAGHLYILRHRQHQPDGGGVYGNAVAGFLVCASGCAAARGIDCRCRTSGNTSYRQRQYVDAAR